MNKIIVAIILALGIAIEVAPRIVEAGARWCPHCLINPPLPW